MVLIAFPNPACAIKTGMIFGFGNQWFVCITDRLVHRIIIVKRGRGVSLGPQINGIEVFFSLHQAPLLNIAMYFAFLNVINERMLSYTMTGRKSSHIWERCEDNH